MSTELNIARELIRLYGAGIRPQIVAGNHRECQDFEALIRAARETIVDSAIDSTGSTQSSELPIIPGLLRRHELEHGIIYAPCDAKGEAVQGIYERISGAAYIEGITLDPEDSNRPGGINFEYIGETKMFWEGQEPEYNAKGEYQFITQDGAELSESQLYYREVKS